MVVADLAQGGKVPRALVLVIITLHYIIHHITLHYITLMTLHNITLHYIIITLHYS
jgi:hypothetical protein